MAAEVTPWARSNAPTKSMKGSAGRPAGRSPPTASASWGTVGTLPMTSWMTWPDVCVFRSSRKSRRMTSRT